MEAVLKNLASTTELLAATQTGVVEQWDKQTVERAFHWARYCEQLYSRFHTNPAIRKVMENQLQLTNQSLRATFPGYTEVSFSDLARCQHVLLVRLLNNPVLPSSIVKILFDTPSPNENDVTGHCTRLIECKSACKVLSAIKVGAVSAAVGPDAEVQGVMLMERLDALLRHQGGQARKAEQFLDSVLQRCEGAAGCFCLLVAAALLTRENTAAGNASQDFLLNWLQQRDDLLQNLCSASPAGLLLELAKENVKFRAAYCDVLKKWASDMEYDIHEGEWVQARENTGVSFEKLAEHFRGLLEACPSLREDTEEEISVLKVSDGDFDVRGLSVWGDLLLEMKK
ncbi:Fanconi anemia group F protein [Centroberyx gerrardi]